MAEIFKAIGVLKSCENIRLFDLSLSKVNQNGRGKLRAVFSAGKNKAAAVDKLSAVMLNSSEKMTL